MQTILLSVFILSALAFGQSKPLIMEHADSLSVERGRSYLLLQGGVRFRHDSVQLRTERAVWDKNLDMVRCEGGFLFLHPKGSLQSRSGEYYRKDQKAFASGSVVARDSANEGAYYGERAVYDRKNDFLDLQVAPVLYRFEKDTVKHTIDTTKIVAQHITYQKKSGLATAMGAVRVTRGDLVVTCDSGWFDQKKGLMTLKGHPVCVLKENKLSGDSMHIVLDGQKLKTVRVIRNAFGVQDDKPKNGDPLKHTEVRGDTLFAEFANDKMKSLFVSVSAHGEFWEADLKDYVNKMSGNLLTLRFEDGHMQEARVMGSAKSTYWYPDKMRLISGRNEAMGDSILVTFDSSKVQRLRIKGKLANGVFYDLSKKNGKGSTLGSSLDSLSKAGATSHPSDSTRTAPTKPIFGIPFMKPMPPKSESGVLKK